MAEKSKLSLKEKLAQERKKRATSTNVSLTTKKPLKTAKKDLKTLTKQVDEIHKTEKTPTKARKKPVPKKVVKESKERFTLWLSESVYKSFKIHTATRKGSGSDYIEELIKKDLKLK